jgi:DNA polymerase I-like protein with 3'-5' exonuclease and polymerase domains
LGVQYGISAQTLAERIGTGLAEAENLLRLHHKTFSKFWEWSDAAMDYGQLGGELATVFGWTLKVGRGFAARHGTFGNASSAEAGVSVTEARRRFAARKSMFRTLRNYPVQANGSEVLRLACCFAIEAGVALCAPVHDALLIEAPSEELGHWIKVAQDAMQQASEVVLGGFPLRSKAHEVQSPNRFLHMDKPDLRMWNDFAKGLGVK